MTHGVLRISAIALGAAAFAILSPLAAADARGSSPAHGVHRKVAHVHGRVYAHHNVRHYAHGYAYGGYNPGAAAAAGLIGGVLGGLAGGYPYGCDYYVLRPVTGIRLR